MHLPSIRLPALCLSVVMALVLGLALPGAGRAQALEETIVNHIPGRYATLILSGADPAAELDEDAIYARAKAHRDRLEVAHLQYLVYPDGPRTGDGILAFGEIRRDFRAGIIHFRRTTNPLQGKLLERLMGHESSTLALHAAYRDDPAAAEAMNGKPVLLSIPVPDVTAVEGDKAVIVLPVGDGGDVRLHVDLQDPFMPLLRARSQIFVRAFPRGLILNSVQADAEIIGDWTDFSIDGEIYPQEAIWPELADQEDRKNREDQEDQEEPTVVFHIPVPD